MKYIYLKKKMPKNSFSISSQFWLHYLLKKTENKKELNQKVTTRKIIAQITLKKQSYSEIVKKKKTWTKNIKKVTETIYKMVLVEN